MKNKVVRACMELVFKIDFQDSVNAYSIGGSGDDIGMLELDLSYPDLSESSGGTGNVYTNSVKPINF